MRSRSASCTPTSTPGTSARVADALRGALPELHVSASHEVLSVFREYERTSTTVIDAYLSPLLARLPRAARRTRGRARACPAPEIMQLERRPDRAGGGGRRHAAWTVLSGPAAGAVGAASQGGLAGSDDVISFDMGGTSCDVAVVDGGRVRQATGQAIAGRVLQLPMVDVHTVGAGGGSIGWADAGGALRVGPHSAGADPGPACYGRGGTRPPSPTRTSCSATSTPDSTLAGGVELDAEAAERAVDGSRPTGSASR